jgi:hypothetical protein
MERALKALVRMEEDVPVELFLASAALAAFLIFVVHSWS